MGGDVSKASHAYRCLRNIRVTAYSKLVLCDKYSLKISLFHCSSSWIVAPTYPLTGKIL